MKLNTRIAAYATDELRKIFVDETKNRAMVTDGFHAAYVKLDGDDGDLHVNADPETQAKVFAPMVKPERLVASVLMDARLLRNCVKQLKVHLGDDETPDDRRVLMEIYERNNDEYIVAFAQPECAALLMGMRRSVATPMQAWRPYLDDPELVEKQELDHGSATE